MSLKTSQPIPHCAPSTHADVCRQRHSPCLSDGTLCMPVPCICPSTYLSVQPRCASASSPTHLSAAPISGQRAPAQQRTPITNAYELYIRLVLHTHCTPSCSCTNQPLDTPSTNSCHQQPLCNVHLLHTPACPAIRHAACLLGCHPVLD